MTKTTKAIIASAAIAGLISGAASHVFAGNNGSAAGVQAFGMEKMADGCSGKDGCKGHDAAEKHDCKGKNSCKGKGGCKSGDNGCKGKNSCKGKGGCKSEHDKTEGK